MRRTRARNLRCSWRSVLIKAIHRVIGSSCPQGLGLSNQYVSHLGNHTATRRLAGNENHYLETTSDAVSLRDKLIADAIQMLVRPDVEVTL